MNWMQKVLPKNVSKRYFCDRIKLLNDVKSKSDREVCEWIDSFNNNSSMADVGANVGLYSLYAAKKGHKVFAFEPESLNFACLNLNISDNQLNDKIMAFPLAINDENKISSLNLSKMKFNDGFLESYEFMLRNNNHQSPLTSKDRLIKFNDEISTPGYLGVGFKFLDNYISQLNMTQYRLGNFKHSISS